MALVDYSDSEESDAERSDQTPVAKAPAASTKSTFQKVVDRSNPGKIRVSLPQHDTKETGTHEPPAKRAKLEGGGLGGFNSFLPAPKRTGGTGPGGSGGNTGRTSGLAAGVSLKTGVAPGFSRELDPESERAGDENEYSSVLSDNGESLDPLAQNTTDIPQKSAEEVKLVGKPLMFKPLSVTRKTAKKKKAADATHQIPKPSNSDASSAQSKIDNPTQKPVGPLFSVSSEDDYSTVTASNSEYRPMIYGTIPEDDAETSGDLDDHVFDEQLNAAHRITTSESSSFGTQSLDNIASDLNLSAAERRQLFGRQKGGMASATKIINFNTDDEYNHNEELRASGEQAVHNPVRAIAPGKHSLKQLLNAATSQKEALEESFAAGRNNRKEAGSRYGW